MLSRYYSLLWLLTSVLATDEPEKGACVNQPASACPVPDKKSSCLCQRIEADSTVICCNIRTESELKDGLNCAFQKKEQSAILQKETPSVQKKDNQAISQQAKLPPTPVTALHILNSTLERLDVGQPYFQNLIGLSVTQSRISRIMNKFPSSITCLNLSSNHLLEIDPQALTSTPHLGYLDLSNNSLTHPPTLELKNVKAYFFLDLSSNVKLHCKALISLKTNASSQLNFVNQDETYCTSRSDYNWFDSETIIPFHQLDFFDIINKECPKGPGFQCNCSFIRKVEMMKVGNKSKTKEMFISVDCSNRGLTQLPEDVPVQTLLLNVSYNNITHLDFLVHRDSYKNILHLYADNNKIESMSLLEGSHFIKFFTTLSLRNNYIKEIPKYFLKNVFDRNSFHQELKLGKNRLLCDCSTAQTLKVWLLANKPHIVDYDELLCKNINNMRVVDLDQSKVCLQTKDWTDYIYYIIALEILLFVLLISKVSYDYWVFKTTGYLPWPASKMPRLPCDWVFEL